MTGERTAALARRALASLCNFASMSSDRVTAPQGRPSHPGHTRVLVVGKRAAVSRSASQSVGYAGRYAAGGSVTRQAQPTTGYSDIDGVRIPHRQ